MNKKYTFLELLKEDNPKINRFIEFLMPKLQEFFENKYGGTQHWVGAADSTMDNFNKDGKYDIILDRVKDYAEQMGELVEKSKKISKLGVDELINLYDEYTKIHSDYHSYLASAAHIRAFYSDFMKQYGLTPEIMVLLHNRFKEEVYEDASIEYYKDFSGLQLNFGLPADRNYTVKETHNSLWGKDAYRIVEDNLGEMYLILKPDYRRSGDITPENLSNIYFITISDTGEAHNYILEVEFKRIIQDLEGSMEGVHFTDEDWGELVRCLNSKREYLEKETGETFNNGPNPNLVRDIASDLHWQETCGNWFDTIQEYDTLATIWLRYIKNVYDL
jgi:hypothetical protein